MYEVYGFIYTDMCVNDRGRDATMVFINCRLLILQIHKIAYVNLYWIVVELHQNPLVIFYIIL